jgi:hypothetical protein
VDRFFRPAYRQGKQQCGSKYGASHDIGLFLMQPTVYTEDIKVPLHVYYLHDLNTPGRGNFCYRGQMLTKFSLIVVLALTALPVAARKQIDPKREGQAALAAGGYTKAYEIWWPSATMGRDSEIQESFALLMFSDLPLKVRFDGKRKDLALHMLTRSALNGRASAMQRMAAGSANGWLGLAKDLRSAACWSQAAAGALSPAGCLAVTRYQSEAGRPHCDELVMMEESRGRDGRLDAELCLANETPAMLIPMSPPTQKYLDALAKVYGRYGIEWMSRGDALDEGMMNHMQAFNDRMAGDIERRHGADVFDRIDAELKAEMGW